MRLKKINRSLLDHYQVGSTKVMVKSHGASRTLRLKIDPIHKIPVLTVPLNCNLNFIKKFLDQSHDWLMEQMAPFKTSSISEKILFKGAYYQVCCMAAESANGTLGIDENTKTIHVNCDESLALQKVKRLLRRQALIYAQMQSSLWAQKLNVTFKDVLVKDYRSRWGSCSSQGILTYSWRLIQAPSQIFDYVCAHEVAHLIHLNHSADFWKVVASICPHYHESRHWLKINGSQLFHCI